MIGASFLFFCMETAPDSLDNLLMGNVSETVSETPNEEITQRIAATQAKLQGLKKDETKQTEFDRFLANIIPSLEKESILFVLFLIDNQVPSLTIIAFLSLHEYRCKALCEKEFTPFVTTWAQYNHWNIQESLQQEISRWWTFVLGADHLSTTTSLHDFRTQKELCVQFLSHIRTFLAQDNKSFSSHTFTFQWEPHLLLRCTQLEN